MFMSLWANWRKQRATCFLIALLFRRCFLLFVDWTQIVDVANFLISSSIYSLSVSFVLAVYLCVCWRYIGLLQSSNNFQRLHFLFRIPATNLTVLQHYDQTWQQIPDAKLQAFLVTHARQGATQGSSKQRASIHWESGQRLLTVIMSNFH